MPRLSSPLYLPIDEGLDIGVIEVQTHHFGGSARGAAGFDRGGRAVADLEEAHKTGAASAPERGSPSPRRLLKFVPVPEPNLKRRASYPQIHDAAFINHVIRHGLDKAGMGLGMRVGVGAALHLSRCGLAVVMALRGTRDAVGIMEARVEPLGTIGSSHLVDEHVTELVFKGLRVLGRLEVAVLLGPAPPAAGEAPDDLFHGALGPGNNLPLLVLDDVPLRIVLGNTRLAEILETTISVATCDQLAGISAPPSQRRRSRQCS